MTPLLLASASPRRRALLEQAGVALEIRAANVDESPLAGEPPRAYVARIAAAKAQAVARAPGQFVLAADTTVTIAGAILGKAETEGEAAAMLWQLAGRVHQVITAFTVIGDDHRHDGIVSTDVAMVAFDPATIVDYVASGEWRGKAGAYAIQGIAAGLVREVHGSVTNVIGLPLAEVLAVLRALGAPAERLALGIPA